MRLARFQLPGILFASALGLFGCQQSVGGRCVQDSDCSSGHCSIDGETAQGGICQPTPSGTITSTGGTVGGGGASGAGGLGGAGGMSTSDGSTDAPAVDASSGGTGGAGGAAQDGATD